MKDKLAVSLNTVIPEETKHFVYLLRMIREGQKKTIGDWNILVRTALSEVDETITRDFSTSNTETFSFEGYRKDMESLGKKVEG